MKPREHSGALPDLLQAGLVAVIAATVLPLFGDLQPWARVVISLTAAALLAGLIRWRARSAKKLAEADARAAGEAARLAREQAVPEDARQILAMVKADEVHGVVFSRTLGGDSLGIGGRGFQTKPGMPETNAEIRRLLSAIELLEGEGALKRTSRDRNSSVWHLGLNAERFAEQFPPSRPFNPSEWKSLDR